MADKDKTVFISYRRDVSAYLARAVFADLREHGYDVFMDVESIDSGDFDTIILNQIAARAHFIVILTPGTLEKINKPGDWLRIEIERAMDLDRNIVPLMTYDFSFEDAEPYLSGKMERLSRYNGITIHHDYFVAAMDKLRDRFLKVPVYVSIMPTPAGEGEAVQRIIQEAADKLTPTKAELSDREYIAPDLSNSEEGEDKELPKPQHPVIIDAPEILTITTPLQMELVRVPAGEFQMGSDPTEDKDAHDNEQPRYPQQVAEFYIGKYQVTNTQYSLFVKAKNRKVPRHWVSGDVPEGKADHPVVYVNWYDALAFCEWLHGETGKEFSLPSEVQWEYAARGGPLSNNFLFSGSNNPGDVAWSKANSGGHTHPVGKKQPNELGIYDMSGNVLEWTRSLWGEDWQKPDFKYPYDPQDGREDLGAPGHIHRVLRGGSFVFGLVGMRCAFRGWFLPDVRIEEFGLRVVVSQSGSDL